MAWIKRNLFFTIGGVIALLLLGAAGYYDLKCWSDKKKNMDALTEAYSDLQNYLTQIPSPGNDKVDNIATAQEQEQQLRQWIEKAKKHFKVAPPIPNPSNGTVTTEEFAGSLRKTIQDLQLEATNANVGLPLDYSFSFAAERNLVTFAPGSLNALASHLGEVKAICEVLFSANINAIDGIQREVVSDNDTTGAQADYLTDKTQSSDTVTITPYTVTFNCFSKDLGNVISKLASSDYCFLVKAINVMPAAGIQGANGGEQNPAPGNGNQPMMPAPTQNGGLQKALDEQLLQVTLAIEVVKLSNK